jgi:hypothetical protein
MVYYKAKIRKINQKVKFFLNYFLGFFIDENALLYAGDVLS